MIHTKYTQTACNYNHFFIMITNHNDNNRKKRPAAAVSGNVMVETAIEQKEKGNTNEVAIPILGLIIPANLHQQCVKVYNDLCLCNKTVQQSYEPVEQQVKLILEGGYDDKMAYTATGTHLESCNSCCCDDDVMMTRI